MSSARKNIIDNCKMLSSKGNFLAFIDLKRFNWYLNKKLAERIDEKTIKLNFAINEDNVKVVEFAKHPIDKKCVICGSEHNLNKHHVIPVMFRKYLPEDYKKYNSHDVLIVCIDCHEDYEQSANNLKDELINGFSNDIYFYQKIKDDKKHNKKINNAKFALLNFDVPLERKKELENLISQGLVEERNIIKDIVDSYLNNNIEDLIFLWRKHFVENTKPKYLPKGWSVNSPVKFASEFM